MNGWMVLADQWLKKGKTQKEGKLQISIEY